MRATPFFILIVSLYTGSAAASGQPLDDTLIWNDFVRLVRSHQFPVEKIRPVIPGTEQTVLGFLNTLGNSLTEEEWGRKPEVYHVGDLVHYVVPFQEGSDTVPYSFSFLVEDGVWYFHHLESVTIRLDKVGALPVATFPDIPEIKKAWIRQEFYWSQMVYLFNYLAKDKGKEAAFTFFNDGAGYFLAAKTWVPLVTPQRAFILYLCWEQANLQGNPVTLATLTDREAVVRMDPMYLRLYEQTSHLRLQISREDYDRIFETVWQDRSMNAGWNLEIRRKGTECEFQFQRRAD